MIQPHFSQGLGNSLIHSLIEVLGSQAVEGLLERLNISNSSGGKPEAKPITQFDFAVVSRLMAGLEEEFGVRSGRGLATRTGRVLFNYSLQTFRSSLSLSTTSFRLLPMPAKLRNGLNAMADLINNNSDQVVFIKEETDRFLWSHKPCALCWQRKSEQPACFLTTGFLQESLYWLSGGKAYKVEEIKCIASGQSECTYLIEKKPIS